MKRLLLAATILAAATLSANATTTVLEGTICDNTCFVASSFTGDNTPVEFDGLPWPIGTELSGKYTITITGNVYSFTANGATLTWTAPNPHFAIIDAPPQYGFPAGTLELVISGLSSSWGFAGPMVEQLCDPTVPGVPEPSTWAMMLVGFASLGLVLRRRFPKEIA